MYTGPLESLFTLHSFFAVFVAHLATILMFLSVPVHYYFKLLFAAVTLPRCERGSLHQLNKYLYADRFLDTLTIPTAES